MNICGLSVSYEELVNWMGNVSICNTTYFNQYQSNTPNNYQEFVEREIANGAPDFMIDHYQERPQFLEAWMLLSKDQLKTHLDQQMDQYNQCFVSNDNKEMDTSDASDQEISKDWLDLPLDEYANHMEM